MALTTLFLTGFEHGLASTNGSGLFSNVTGAAIASSGMRNGSYCLETNAALNTATYAQQTFASNAKVVCRVAFKVTSFPSSYADVFQMRGSGNCGFQVDSSGNTRAYIGAGATKAGPTIDHNWHILEMQIDTSANPWTMDWKVDGVSYTQATNAVAAGTISTVEWGNHAATHAAFDAFYDDTIVGTWTVAGTDWYGDGFAAAQLAASDGTHNTVGDFAYGDAGSALTGTVTDAYTMVDDAPGSDGWTATRSTTDNLAMINANTTSYLEIAPATTARGGSANAVRAIASYSASTTSANAAAVDVRNSAAAVTAINGTTGGTLAGFNVTSNNFKGAIVTMPGGGWTASEVNAVRWRFGGGTSSDVSPIPTVQALMLEVDWPTIVYTDTASGTITLTGSETDTYVDCPPGTMGLTGAISESYSSESIYYDDPSGTLSITGACTEGRGYNDGMHTAYMSLHGSTTDTHASTGVDHPQYEVYFGETYPAGMGDFPPAGALVPSEPPKQVRIVRELPPTRLSYDITTPKGMHYRWAGDETIGGNVPSGGRHSSTAPGGYESLDCVLPRSPRETYADLEPLSTIRLKGPGGEEVGEYRLEATPEASGDQMAISPSAVGWQAHLADSEAQSLLVIDRDMNKWTSTPATRGSNLYSGGYGSPDSFTAAPGVPGTLSASYDKFDQSAGPWPITESYYDAGPGCAIGQIKADYATNGTWTGWNLMMYLWNTDYTLDASGTYYGSPSNPLAASGGFTTPVSVSRPDSTYHWRRAIIQFFRNTALTSSEVVSAGFVNMRVIGAHGLTLYQPSTDDYDAAVAAGFPGSQAEYNAMTEGFLASDVVGYILTHFAPMLTWDASTIQPSTFIIPQLAFSNTTAGDMVNQTIRFGEPTPDWFVWGNRTFYMHDRGINNRHWRARIGPARLSETGADISKLWNRVWVAYTDVDGTQRVVGPPPVTDPLPTLRAGVTLPADICVPDKSYDTLVDTNPDNPLNQLGMRRQTLLTLNTPVGHIDDAAKLGEYFLEQTKQINRSGQAQATGYIEDRDTGSLYPYWAAKAGDDIEYVDAADTSARRINHVDNDHTSKTATLSLDAPPDTLAGLLERMGAVITPLGL